MVDSNLVNEALSQVITTTVAAKDFIPAEAPDVVEQLITFNIVESIVYAFLGLLLISISAIVIYLISKNIHRVEDKIAMSLTAGSFTTLPGVAVFCVHLVEVLKLWIAPKVWLIEYAAELIK